MLTSLSSLPLVHSWTEKGLTKTLCRLGNSFHMYIAVLSKLEQNFKQEIKQLLRLPNKGFLVSCNTNKMYC